MKKRILQGLTLIEMLVVISLLAVIVSVFLINVHHQAESLQRNKVSLEIQGVLQAAIAFEDRYGSWPPASTTACGVAAPLTKRLQDSLSDFINYYLPNSSTHSSLGSSYCWSPDTSTSGLSQKFWVALQVPGTGANANRYARQLVTSLPDAEAVQDPASVLATPCSSAGSAPCYIKTAVFKSGAVAGQDSSDWTMAGFGQCDPSTTAAVPSEIGSDVACTYTNSGMGTSNDYDITFPCSSSETPGIQTMLNNVTLGAFDYSASDAGYYALLKQLHTTATNSSCSHSVGGGCECQVSVAGNMYVYVQYEDLPPSPTPSYTSPWPASGEASSGESFNVQSALGLSYYVYTKGST